MYNILIYIMSNVSLYSTKKREINTISGVVFEEDTNTKKRYVRIDFDQHGRAMIPFLGQIGVIDKSDDFWEEYANAITSEEFRQRMYQRIDAWKWNVK